MDDLIKAIKCQQQAMAFCDGVCEVCEYNQSKYILNDELFNDIYERISALEKSNKTWRRKCQRLRHELKEVKKNGIP